MQFSDQVECNWVCKWDEILHTTSPGMAQYNSLAGCTSTVNGCTSTTTNPYLNRTLAIAYDSYLRGDFRFSVAQLTGASSDAVGQAVDFNSTEGMYFRNADVHLALGQLFYQALTINMPRSVSNNSPVKDGNFTLEIPILPNIQAVYTRFYSLTDYSGVVSPNAYDDGYATARAAYLSGLPVRGGSSTPAYMQASTAAVPACAASPTAYCRPDANYAKTHGYARWGDWAPCTGVGCSIPVGVNTAAQALAGTGRNAWNSSGDGVFFVATDSFNAYAYSAIDVDVSTGNQYTAVAYYKGTTIKGNGSAASTNPPMDIRTNAVFNSTTADFSSSRADPVYTVSTFNACTASSATSYNCGSGGSYNGASTDTSYLNTNIPVERYWMSAGASAGTATYRPYIVVPAGGALNLGDARLEGIQLNFLRFTSYGALN